MEQKKKNIIEECSNGEDIELAPMSFGLRLRQIRRNWERRRMSLRPGSAPPSRYSAVMKADRELPKSLW